MKWRVVAVVCLFLALGLGGQIFAQTQATVTGNGYWTDTIKFMPIDKDHAIVMADDQMGVFVTDSGKGPFNNLSGHCVWLDSSAAGKDHWYGFTVFTYNDGDKIFWEIHEGSAQNTARGKILWGSGKFEGIEGTSDYAFQVAKSWPDGTRPMIIPHGVWKLTLKKPLPQE
jgi:hypothetical protein